MRSFRTKTVFLSVTLSGLLLATTGVVAWERLKALLENSVEEKITLPGARIAAFRGLGTDWERFNQTLDLAFSEGWKEDRIFKVRANLGDRRTLFASEDWLADFPFKDVPNFQSYQSQMRDEPVARDREHHDRHPLLTEPYLYDVTAFGSHWRLVTYTSPELTLYIGINLDNYLADISRIRAIYFGALALVILSIGFGGYKIASQALKPVDAIADAAQRITSKDLSERITTSSQYDQEFDRLVAVINEMMDRLESSFQQAMRFTSDASHELKTPLANIQNEITSRLQDCEADSVEHKTLNRLQDEVQWLKQIIRSLFLLSQADAGTMPLTLANYNFSEQVDSFTQDSELLSADAGLETKIDIEPDLFIRADELMIGQVMRNLISNSIKHNVPGGFVNWSLYSQNGNTVFATENSGLPIEPDEQPRLFQRFFRGRSTRSSKSPGMGLGLSLAKEIALAHGGSLALATCEADRIRFELTLPKANSQDG